MKKFILIFLISLSFITPVKAKNYKTDNQGNYYVQSAICAYHEDNFLDTTYKVIFKEGKLEGVESYNKKGEKAKSFSYKMPGLNYSDFFKNKEFTCPTKIYFDPATPHGTDFYASCSKDSDGNCEAANILTASYVAEQSQRSEYIEEETSSTPIKQEILTCSYIKTTSSAGSQTQAEAAGELFYHRYSDNSHTLIDGNNNELPLNSSSNYISTCEDNIDIYIKKDKTNYTIVKSCNENTDANCFVYRLEKYSNNNLVDNGIKDDGTSSNAPELVNPGSIATFLPDDYLSGDANVCTSYLGSPNDKDAPAYYLQFAFNLLKYAAILLLFAMTIVDFFKATTSDKDEGLKKALKTAVKRLIIVVIIFFIPLLIEFIFEMFGIYTDPSCIVGK